MPICCECYWMSLSVFFLFSPVGDRDLPSPSSRAESGNKCHRERAQKAESECGGPIGRLFGHGQTLLPLTEWKARARCWTRTLCRQVTAWNRATSVFLCECEIICDGIPAFWIVNFTLNSAWEVCYYFYKQSDFPLSLDGWWDLCWWMDQSHIYKPVNRWDLLSFSWLQ